MKSGNRAWPAGRWAVAALLWSSVSYPLFAAPAGQVARTLFIGVENYRWQEYDSGGSRLLTEQGPRLVAAGVFDNAGRTASGIFFSATVKGYAGSVDYDGQDGNGVYTSSTSSYLGWGAVIDGGYRLRRGERGSQIDIRAGVGYEGWRRDINSSVNANGQPVGGVVEDYGIAFGRIGLGLPLGMISGRGHVDLGLKRPLTVSERVTVDGAPIHLAPRPEWSFYASYLIPYGSDETRYVRFYYDSIRFGQSPSKVTPLPRTVWQPESKADIVGLALGVRF